MAKNSLISWCRHTHNHWIGCTEDGPECDNCYAKRTFDLRLHVATWGKGQPRHLTSEDNRRRPYAWDAAARTAGEIHTVFAHSLSDWADTEVPEDWRFELFRTIRATPNLFWLLLTKRANHALKLLSDPAWWRACFGDDWQTARQDVAGRIAIGVTAGTAASAHARLPLLKKMPWCAGIFVSMGPLLERVDLTHIRTREGVLDVLRGTMDGGPLPAGFNNNTPFIIVEGESGTNREGCRPVAPLHPDLVRDIRDQCVAAGHGDKFHFKQWGEYVETPRPHAVLTGPACRACGCTERRACHDEVTGQGCHWVIAPDAGDQAGPLCSVCARIEPGARPVSYKRVGTKAAGYLLDGRVHQPEAHFVPRPTAPGFPFAQTGHSLVAGRASAGKRAPQDAFGKAVP